MRRRSADERGQVVVLFALLLVPVLIGFAALVVDVGSWYGEHRRLQSIADAAALAGVQELPDDEEAARAVALDYAARNGAATVNVTFPDSGAIEVHARKVVPGFFSVLYGVDTLTIGARARAAVGIPGAIRFAAPIVVHVRQEKLDPGRGCPCFDEPTTIVLSDDASVGSGTFGLADIGRVGNPGSSVLNSWITEGMDAPMRAPDWYVAVTGEKIGQIRSGLEATVGKVLLFPVYDAVDTSTKSYHIIAWAAFVIDPGGIRWNGNTRTITGHFVERVVPAEEWVTEGGGYGVRSIRLTE